MYATFLHEICTQDATPQQAHVDAFAENSLMLSLASQLSWPLLNATRTEAKNRFKIWTFCWRARCAFFVHCGSLASGSLQLLRITAS